ncbi:hypothetical protein RHGRI_024339 [Rhododendron griersonianum]|uniref:SURP motif domain-containing protein n=1 Tax=Rhododendron griersonianum TaxID=479676 RepID=A0AAV6J6V5_9ERIC|nr:hypothetical protein RHGRI_024339 [Rhododendron griersonianum]
MLFKWILLVIDEEGRRRFHGAFTGGYSAGYYNTVGSKEGWIPQTFTSSRKNRAEIKQQSILNFLDEDEKGEMEGRSLGTSMKFDTFGFTAAEIARKQAEKEQQQRPSIIPGPAPDELVFPATYSIGVKLLLKMGWRHGHAIKDSRTNSLYVALDIKVDARREARKAFLALSSDDTAAQRTGSEDVKGDLGNIVELPMDNDHQSPHSTPVYVLNPKRDLHGLGYDPFKHAPEFREKKRSRLHEDKELVNRKPLSIKDNLFAFRCLLFLNSIYLNASAGRVAPGFGIGALEELDAEDEDVYASGYAFEETYVQEIEEPTKQGVDKTKKRSGKEQGVLPGFKLASNSDYQLERFDPPVIPKDFVPCHKFPALLDMNTKFSDGPPPEIPPPEDNNLKILIEGVAAIVARCGKLFEDLSREKNQSNPLFSFLNGGDGHDYYSRKLWEERQKRNDSKKLELDGKVVPSIQKMTAESRGKILGERPLERSSKDLSSASTSSNVQLQFHLSDTFTKPESFNEVPDAAKPFRDDPAKQGRFEQFLKDKYDGGLRSKDSSGASNMSEAARARERLEFEAAAEAIRKGNWGKETSHFNQQMWDMPTTTSLQFTSAGLEKVAQVEELMKKMYPKREEFQWRPSPILCKRFDILDPYLGKGKNDQITENEKPLIDYSKEAQQSPVIPLEEPLNVSCVGTVGELKKLVAGLAFEMCLKASNLSKSSSELTTSTTIAEHQKDEMPPIEDSGNFLEDTRVGSEESSVPSSNKTNEVKQTVSSLESSNPSIVTGWLPKLAYVLPKEMACEPSCCVGDQCATYLILNSKLPDHMCSRKHGNSKIPPTSIFIREDFKDFSSTSIDSIIPEKFNFGNGMTLFLSFLPAMKKI